jgi:hypothetical protein
LIHHFRRHRQTQTRGIRNPNQGKSKYTNERSKRENPEEESKRKAEKQMKEAEEG